MRKILIGGLVAAVLLGAGPVWAHHGHGNWKHGKHWRGHPVHGAYVHRQYVVREVVRPVPVYPRVAYPVYPAPAPGIHIVVPNVYIPF